VEAGPKRTEELSEAILQQLLTLIRTFPQIKTVDLTGGAPEMNYGFRDLVETSRQFNKEVIVRSNLTIFFVPGYEDLPDYFAKNQVRVVASLPCYLEDNVDRQRGNGVYSESIQALQLLNQRGYGQGNLVLDLVYNPPIPVDTNFRLTPNQESLTVDYKTYLADNFGIQFNQLFTITNLPIGRTKQTLAQRGLVDPYLQFLGDRHNPDTVENLMCRQQLSVDYLGNLYDCDFNQMEGIAAADQTGKKLTVSDLIDANSLDLIKTVKTANYCYGCTAGSGSSCGGSLV
jgi:radical SAM/Cys-rich protein